MKRFVTAASSGEKRLRGRAYPIRFGTVWRAAIQVAASLNGWRVLGTDARAGEIRAEASGRVWKRPDEVSVLLSLDGMGLTRVDLVLTPRSRRLGGGPSFRRIRRFLRALDAALRSSP